MYLYIYLFGGFILVASAKQAENYVHLLMLFTLNHSGGYVEVLILVLVCTSEMTDGLEHFF